MVFALLNALALFWDAEKICIKSSLGLRIAVLLLSIFFPIRIS